MPPLTKKRRAKLQARINRKYGYQEYADKDVSGPLVRRARAWFVRSSAIHTRRIGG